MASSHLAAKAQRSPTARSAGRWHVMAAGCVRPIQDSQHRHPDINDGKHRSTRAERRAAGRAGNARIWHGTRQQALSSLTAYSAKGLRTWTPASSKSLTLRVTTVMPCTRAVAAMSASITGRGCAYC